MEVLKCSNIHPCTCPNVGCERHGRCCECVASHLTKDILPGCFRAVMAEKEKQQ